MCGGAGQRAAGRLRVRAGVGSAGAGVGVSEGGALVCGDGGSEAAYLGGQLLLAWVWVLAPHSPIYSGDLGATQMLGMLCAGLRVSPRAPSPLHKQHGRDEPGGTSQATA